VPDELAGQIFVPFFSTKERSSGVGLAVVRQLLHSNGGAVRYVKPVRGGAQFSISF
jgi:C4-dicarboxylate-specific signal transduction histidine kinase